MKVRLNRNKLPCEFRLNLDMSYFAGLMSIVSSMGMFRIDGLFGLWSGALLLTFLWNLESMTLSELPIRGNKHIIEKHISSMQIVLVLAFIFTVFSISSFRYLGYRVLWNCCRLIEHFILLHEDESLECTQNRSGRYLKSTSTVSLEWDVPWK